MDLLKTLMLYMSLVFATSVQTAPEPSYIPQEATPAPTVYTQTATPVPTPKPTPVPTINITPNPAYKTIQVGDNGEQVKEMQAKLAEYGYYEGEIDGRFGNQTRRAVEKFQYHHGLSADGIAGRKTLTVLYESPEIRMAPDGEPTPEPTPETQLAAAITPEPTPEPTFAPVETISVTATPEPVAVQPTPVPEMTVMEGWTMEANGEKVTLKGDEETVLAPYKAGEELYLPLTDVLTCAYLNVISSDSLEMDEFAFAIGNNIFRVAYTENQAGEPTNVEVFQNNEAQLMPIRDIRRVDQAIYLPAVSIEKLTGITVQADEEASVIRITIPVLDEE